ncbi:MAG: LysR family transcriptional regulator [Alphaproteobacteria bacterium]|jgi:DNA-binding transcriptional LysR family regulator|nr:LysR family transcriptional regulator [Alphaproteobacteria bacterium]
MDIDLLRAFVAVAETHSFSAAARRLNCTQAAASQKIRRLEAQLGGPLFARTSRSVALTDSGQMLLAYAGRMLRLHEEAAAAVTAVRRGPRLRFGISEEQALRHLPAVLPRYLVAMPDVQLEVHCDGSTALVERVLEGQLDLALGIRHAGMPGGEAVGRETLCWVAGGGFVPDPVQPLPLAVNPEGCVYRAYAFDALNRMNRRWQVVYTSQSPTGINIAVQLGMAVTVKAARSVPPGCRVLGEADGLPGLPQAEVELHQATRVQLPTAARIFRAVLLEVLADAMDDAPSPALPALGLGA